MELHLKHGEDLLGVLQRYDSDFPWFKCSFEATANFSQVKHLFDDELVLLEANQMDEWEVAYQRINALGLKLVDSETKEEIGEFLLHIQGSEAWVRY